MPLIDTEALLAELSPDAPCGEDLSYDPAYSELERVMQPAQEGMVGDVEAEGPNWREVSKAALTLFERTKDLRVGLYLALAALQQEGLPGLRDGLALLRGLLEQHWLTVHPQLDPEEDDDPLERINIVAGLAMPEGTFQDPLMFVRRIRDAELCSSRRGRVCLRDIQYAAGEIPAPEDPEFQMPDSDLIAATFQEAEPEALQAVAEAVRECVEHAGAIDSFLTARVGADQAPNLGELTKVLERAKREMEARTVGVGEAAAEGGAAEAGGEGGTGQALSGDIRSVRDVLAALDKICRYYQANEPSSPVPLLLRRAERLVSKGFFAIVQDLAPGSVSALEEILGVDTSAMEE